MPAAGRFRLWLGCYYDYCALGDWTCEGGTTIGIAATASHLALAVTASPNTTHSPYVNPPEIAAWLR